MPTQAARETGEDRVSVTIADGATESSPFKAGPYAGCLAHLPYNTGDLTFLASTSKDGTYVGVWDAAGTQASTTVGGADRAVELPEVVMKGMWVKLVATTAATGAQAISLHLKS